MKSDFSQSSYSQEEFVKLALAGQKNKAKEFSDCTFEKCDFSNSDLGESVFIGCTFRDCDFSGAKIYACAFREAKFSGCKFLGVLFKEANPFLLNWQFEKCRIEICNFTSLKMESSIFKDCTIKETDFIDTNLKKSDFSGCDLKGSIFDGANLEEASFLDAKNYYIDPTKCRLKKAKFSQPEVLALLVGFGLDIK